MLLHVTNGDVTAERLRAGGVPDPVLPWRDVLPDGPVPAGLTPAELRAGRAAFIASRGWGDRQEVEAGFAERDRLLGRAGSVVLWFEADLYDQLQLVQVLDRLRATPPVEIRLVSIGEYPGIPHFAGLGQLEPEQLLGLGSVTLTAADLEHGAAAWKAFTAPDPSGLPAIVRTESAALRFLGEAYARLMQEYPATSDGLSLLQRRALLAVESGAGTAGEVFAEVTRRERRPYLGDWPCWDMLLGLASCRQPLLALGSSAAAGFAARSVALTELGQAVLAGTANHVRSNGIDRWIGGVHLRGSAAAWVYDERRETLLGGT